MNAVTYRVLVRHILTVFNGSACRVALFDAFLGNSVNGHHTSDL